MRDGPDADGLGEVLRADVADLAATTHVRGRRHTVTCMMIAAMALTDLVES